MKSKIQDIVDGYFTRKRATRAPMVTDDDEDILLSKYLDGTASPAEQHRVEQLKTYDPAVREILATLSAAGKFGKTPGIFKMAWKRPAFRLAFQLAAGVVLLCTVAYYGVFHESTPSGRGGSAPASPADQQPPPVRLRGLPTVPVAVSDATERTEPPTALWTNDTTNATAQLEHPQQQ